MKKYINLIFATVIMTGILSGCKKSNSNTPKDYTASIKEKTWWGMFAYTGKDAEYYSLHFNADKTFTWNELSGNYTGKWEIQGKQLVFTFSSGSLIQADISDDDRLVNITGSAKSYTVNSGKLVPTPNVPLENTVWKGTITYGGASPLELDFITGSKVVILIKAVVQGTFPYTRTASGGSISALTGGIGPFFGVITNNNEMMGSSAIASTPWQVTRQ